jgi:hypothetical protein
VTQRGKKRLVLAAVGVLALLQVADVTTTNIFLTIPGLYEGNPIGVAAQTHLGNAWPLVKLLTVPMILFLPLSKSVWPALAMIVLYTTVVLNNLIIIAVS